METLQSTKLSNAGGEVIVETDRFLSCSEWAKTRASHHSGRTHFRVPDDVDLSVVDDLLVNDVSRQCDDKLRECCKAAMYFQMTEVQTLCEEAIQFHPDVVWMMETQEALGLVKPDIIRAIMQKLFSATRTPTRQFLQQHCHADGLCIRSESQLLGFLVSQSFDDLSSVRAENMTERELTLIDADCIGRLQFQDPARHRRHAIEHELSFPPPEKTISFDGLTVCIENRSLFGNMTIELTLNRAARVMWSLTRLGLTESSDRHSIVIELIRSNRPQTSIVLLWFRPQPPQLSATFNYD